MIRKSAGDMGRDFRPTPCEQESRARNRISLLMYILLNVVVNSNLLFGPHAYKDYMRRRMFLSRSRSFQAEPGLYQRRSVPVNTSWHRTSARTPSNSVDLRPECCDSGVTIRY